MQERGTRSLQEAIDEVAELQREHDSFINQTEKKRKRMFAIVHKNLFILTEHKEHIEKNLENLSEFCSARHVTRAVSSLLPSPPSPPRSLSLCSHLLFTLAGQARRLRVAEADRRVGAQGHGEVLPRAHAAPVTEIGGCVQWRRPQASREYSAGGRTGLCSAPTALLCLTAPAPHRDFTPVSTLCAVDVLMSPLVCCPRLLVRACRALSVYCCTVDPSRILDAWTLDA